ncbi:hypothetical protein [Rheinheimera sp.]|uniref:hypothetical protein n=1 Tax=Rheinheimera sp. TaxID=1869214 RepID=UPI0027B9BCC6|nr:hypothetical protein [Rheinheimera sp.]
MQGFSGKTALSAALLLSLLGLLGACGQQQQQTATPAPAASAATETPAAVVSEAVAEPAAEAATAKAGEGNSMTEQHKITVGLDKTELKALYNDIQQMAGKAQANDVAQCRVVGVGAKACGGPQSYLVYSTLSGNETELLQKVERYNALMRMQNEQQGLMSDCAIVPEPGVVLVNGFCQAGPKADLM